MEAQRTITVSLPANVVEELDKMAREENTTRSQILRTAIDQYSRSGRIWKQIYKWGEEAAKDLGIKTEEDVDRLIHEQ
jgi:metal-responsive CopG/Arc/MetJ family transcriptional regulator